MTPVKLYAISERPWAIPAACALESGLSVSRVAAAAAHVSHVGRVGVPGGAGVQVSQLLMQRPWALVHRLSSGDGGGPCLVIGDRVPVRYRT